jgi:FAD:protein FMN transferase
VSGLDTTPAPIGTGDPRARREHPLPPDACPPARTAAGPPVVRSRFEAYGTYGELLLAGRPAALGTALRVLRAELDAIDIACSRFRDDSELVAVNAAAGRAVAVSDLLAEAVEVALTAAAQTGGDVDPTLGGALVAAGYDADYPTLPTDRPAGPPPRPGAWPEVELDRAAGTLRVPAGTVLDLGATAKALAVDRAAAAVAAATGAGVLVNVGGDLAAAGPPPPRGWPVRLTDDTDRTDVTRPGRTGPVVQLHGGGLATSSTVVRRWRRGGRAYHHILDPRTGLPADPVWRTVTVTAATCVDANTASTAAVVRGRGAPAWLAELGLPSRLVDCAGSVHRVAGWPPDRHPDAGPGAEPSGWEDGG